MKKYILQKKYKIYKMYKKIQNIQENIEYKRKQKIYKQIRNIQENTKYTKNAKIQNNRKIQYVQTIPNIPAVKSISLHKSEIRVNYKNN